MLTEVGDEAETIVARDIGGVAIRISAVKLPEGGVELHALGEDDVTLSESLTVLEGVTDTELT